MLEAPNNTLGDALSLTAKYCSDTESHLELAQVLLKEVDAGASAFGFFGSRSRSEEDPKSDIDVLVINPNMKLISSIYGGLPIHERVGTVKELNKGRRHHWIDMLRIAPQYLDKLKDSRTDLTILESTIFVWSDPSFDLNRVTETIEAARNTRLNHLIATWDTTYIDEEFPTTRDRKTVWSRIKSLLVW